MDSAKNQAYIDAYYKTNQTHVKWSFWTSLTALIIGLLSLTIGIGLSLIGRNTAVSTTIAAAGVLTQFISAGFFFIYSKNLKQLNIFYEKLIRNQETFFTISLLGYIPEAERPGIIHGIIGALLSRNGPSTEITPELIKALADAKQPKNHP